MSEGVRNLTFSGTREPRGERPSPESVRGLVSRAFPNERASEAVSLVGGLSNASYRLRLSCSGEVVARLYLRDPAAIRTELSALELLRGCVPVPEILYANEGLEPGAPTPFVIYKYVTGVPFRDVKRSADRTAIAEAAFAVGATLATIGSHRFVALRPRNDDARAQEPQEHMETLLRSVERCFVSTVFRRRLGRATLDGLRALLAAWAPQLRRLETTPMLVHGDFSRSNVLLRPEAGHYRVAAVIDWECARGGPPLIDVGHFLRYENHRAPLLEPHFSNGFAAYGGTLTGDWRRLSRVVDLAAIANGLTKAHLPRGAVTELRELLCSTLAGCATP